MTECASYIGLNSIYKALILNVFYLVAYPIWQDSLVFPGNTSTKFVFLKQLSHASVYLE